MLVYTSILVFIKSQKVQTGVFLYNSGLMDSCSHNSCNLQKIVHFIASQARYRLVNPPTGGCSQFLSSYFASWPSITWNV